MEFLKDPAWIASIAVFLTAILALVSFRADHKRRRRQATFDFYHKIYEGFIEPLSKFIDESGCEKEDKDMPMIRGYLSCMERFAVGINKRVYDFNVFKRTVGAIYTVKLFDQFEDVISEFRKKHSNPLAYEDLEVLVYRLKIEQESKRIHTRWLRRFRRSRRWL